MESITKELRKWGYGFCGDTYEVVNAIADRIESEHERVRAESIIDMTDESMAEHGWVRLPVDADGLPIRVGDVMNGNRGTVTCIRDAGHGWEIVTDHMHSYNPDDLHHHKPTIEDVFTEFAYKLLNHDQTDAMPNRVKRLAKEYADMMRAIIEGSKGPEWQETDSQDEER